MGLTIHYALCSNTRSPKRARELMAKLHGRALGLPFARVGELYELSGTKCDYRQYDRGHLHRWLLIQAGHSVDDPQHEGYSYRVTPTHVLAFSAWPGEGCEEANFGLCRYPATIEVDDPLRRWQRRTIRTRLSGWCWGSFCKTQYASHADYGGVAHFLRCHLTVVKMLDYAQDLGLLASVLDEGSYWENRDVSALARQVGDWNVSIARQAAEFKDILGDGFQAAIAEFPDFADLTASGSSHAHGKA